MPCRSDYMEQTNSEARFQETAKLLVFAWTYCYDHQIPEKYRAAAENEYASNVGQVEALCELLRAVKTRLPRVFETLVYNARNPMSRRLATWWEEHEAEDAARERAEAHLIADRAIFQRLTKNLTADEKRILKEYLR